MKKILVLFAFVLGFGIAANAQTDSKAAAFKFVEETHDFGKVVIGKPVSYEFKFVNQGQEPLIISKAEASCGCTVPKYTSTPIAKGETGVISVTYNPSGAPMPFTKTITITSNAKTPIKVLYIKGETVNAPTK